MTDNARQPVTTAAELAELDPAAMLDGYRDGFAGEIPPGANRGRAYWHGYENGAADRRGVSRLSNFALIRDLRATGSRL